MKLEKLVTYDDTSHLYSSMYQLIGWLPFDNGSWPVVSRFLAGFFHIVNLLCYTMFMADVVRLLLGQDVDIDCVFEFVTAQAGSLKFVMLAAKSAELEALMRHTRELWRLLVEDEGKTVRIFEKRIRWLVYFFMWSGLAVILFYFVTAHMVRLPPVEVNGTERRILPFRFYVDVQEQPWYNIVCVAELIITLNFLLLVTATESVGPYLIMMACGYLRAIQERLTYMRKVVISDDISKNNNNLLQHESSMNKLSITDVRRCIIFHQRVMNYCKEIENVASIPFLVQLMSTTYNVSLIGLKLLERDEKFIKYIPLLIINVFRFFTCQWFAQHLLNESDAIVDAAYSATLTHPTFEPRANRMLFLMMLRANKTVQMTAGGYINLSLETFKSMFTNAISFFTVLRSMNI